VPIQIEDCIFTDQRREQRKKECYGCGKELCGRLSKQAHTQRQEESKKRETPSPHFNQDLG
jgi:hypothetical protein